eukprot:TRINITY_DN1418_c0_g1_i1.p1 TRINITY_DN1418_c0_g1~~TRINITY_DN1418_c0_g1_i1.p1  ORF type:complete len:243 (+),score=45.61 TRINITY_DN1418_c0_g1_i1:68-730(+)
MERVPPMPNEIDRHKWNFTAEQLMPNRPEFLIQPHELQTPGNLVTMNLELQPEMEYFPPEKVDNFKHVIYNLLVEHYNSKFPDSCLVAPCVIMIDNQRINGFQFLKSQNPDKKIPELYAIHARNARLDLQSPDSVFIQDCYKFYLRSALELLGKYFTKSPILPESARYAYIYDDDCPLFIPGGSLKDAEERITKMKTRARKRSDSNGTKNPPKSRKRNLS